MSAGVNLSAANTGFETEEEFDAWVARVVENIDERCGFMVEVDARPFKGQWSGGEDEVRGTDHERQVIREAIRALWDEQG